MPAPIKVNGQEIELPDLDSLNFAEATILYDYSKVTLDKIPELDGLHPGVLAGMLHIAIQRANPDRRAREIREAVETTNLMSLLQSLPQQEDDEADAVPPAQPPAGGANSKSSENGSGDDSTMSSGQPQEKPDQPRSGARVSGSSASAPIRLAG